MMTVDRKEVGRRLRKIRLEKGISISDLSRKLGYKSPSSVSKWESGVQPIPDGTLKLLATELGVGVCDISPDNNVVVNEDSIVKPGDIWSVKLPNEQEQLILILGSGIDTITGLYIQDDTKEKTKYCVDILGDFYVDVSTLHSKPSSFLFKFDSKLSESEYKKVRDGVAEYIGVKTEIKVVENEKIVEIESEKTRQLERQVVDLKAKLYDLMMEVSK